jgi:hypothetical protein
MAIAGHPIATNGKGTAICIRSLFWGHKMKFYDEQRFCIVDIIFWAFIAFVAGTCAFGAFLYFN